MPDREKSVTTLDIFPYIDLFLTPIRFAAIKFLANLNPTKINFPILVKREKLTYLSSSFVWP
jgi:hypothetical protein